VSPPQASVRTDDASGPNDPSSLQSEASIPEEEDLSDDARCTRFSDPSQYALFRPETGDDGCESTVVSDSDEAEARAELEEARCSHLRGLSAKEEPFAGFSAEDAPFSRVCKKARRRKRTIIAGSIADIESDESVKTSPSPSPCSESALPDQPESPSLAVRISIISQPVEPIMLRMLDSDTADSTSVDNGRRGRRRRRIRRKRLDSATLIVSLSKTDSHSLTAGHLCWTA
jgi:hypothetical protein